MPFTCNYGTVAVAKKNFLTSKQASKHSLLALRFPHKNNTVVLVSDLPLLTTITLKNGNWGLLRVRGRTGRDPFLILAQTDKSASRTSQSCSRRCWAEHRSSPFDCSPILVRFWQDLKTLLQRKIKIISLAHPLEKIFYLTSLIKAQFPVW